MAGYNSLTLGGLEREHELCITVYNDVGIMSDYDHLAIVLRFTEALNQQLVDESIVQVIFGLIEDDRLGTITEYKG